MTSPAPFAQPMNPFGNLPPNYIPPLIPYGYYPYHQVMAIPNLPEGAYGPDPGYWTGQLNSPFSGSEPGWYSHSITSFVMTVLSFLALSPGLHSPFSTCSSPQSHSPFPFTPPPLGYNQIKSPPYYPSALNPSPGGLLPPANIFQPNSNRFGDGSEGSDQRGKEFANEDRIFYNNGAPATPGGPGNYLSGEGSLGLSGIGSPSFPGFYHQHPMILSPLVNPTSLQHLHSPLGNPISFHDSLSPGSEYHQPQYHQYKEQ